MTLPSYSAISFDSKESHLASLYDACKLIVDTYDQCDILDNVKVTLYEIGDGGICVLPGEFAQSAKEVMNRIAENQL